LYPFLEKQLNKFTNLRNKTENLIVSNLKQLIIMIKNQQVGTSQLDY